MEMTKNQSQVMTGIILILVLVVGSFFIFGWRNPFEPANAVGVEVDIEYEDGTHTVIRPEELSAFSIVPQQITDPFNRIVKSATFKLKGKANWEGELQSYSWQGYMRVYVDNVLVDEQAINNPSAISKGSYTELADAYADKAQLEEWAGTYGDHTIKITGEVKLKITFKDGTIDSKEGDSEALWKINYGPDPTPSAPVAVSSITTFRITSYVAPVV